MWHLVFQDLLHSTKISNTFIIKSNTKTTNSWSHLWKIRMISLKAIWLPIIFIDGNYFLYNLAYVYTHLFECR